MRTRSVETRLAVRFATHPPGKSQTHVRDIHLVGEYRDTCGADLLGHNAYQVQHDIQIVNHQVQHYVHIQAARAEQAQAMNLEEQREPDHIFQCRNGWIEALQMPDLQDASMAGSGFDQTLGRSEVMSDWLFH